MMKKAKRILILGGADIQIVAIKRAKELGLYVITCDYLPDNPGHKYADEYYNVSTTDKEGVLELAKELKIDAVLAYASEPAAPTAAYLSDKLGLPGNTYRSVINLSRKDFFRKLLRDNGMNYPEFKEIRSEEDAENIFIENSFKKYIIKPVDNSGSKGISLVNSNKEALHAYKYALGFSRENTVIAEEFITKKGYQVGGDGFVVDGNLVFRCFGDIHFNPEINPFLPFSVSIPSTHPAYIQDKIHIEIQKIITASGFKNGALNFDILIDNNENVYIIEIGPRCGGNMIPQLIEKSTGVNLLDFTIKAALGESCNDLHMKDPTQVVSHIVLYTKKPGRLSGIRFTREIESKIFYHHFNFRKDDFIEPAVNTNNRLGIALLKYNSIEEAISIIYNLNTYIKYDFHIDPEDVTLRLLKEEDALTSYKWRNNQKIWKYTVNKPDKTISKEDELNWIRKVLKEQNSRRFAILVCGHYVGNIQFTNIINHEANSGIFIGDDHYWGLGISRYAIDFMIKYAREELNLKIIKGRVRNENQVVINQNKKCGFQITDKDKEFTYMSLIF